MRKSLLDKTGIDIDLTSLLDVIFIILMVVLCYQQANTITEKQNAQNEINQAHDAVRENEMYQDRIDTYENMSDYVKFVTVHVDYDTEDITKRQIFWMLDDNEITQVAEITPDTEKEAYENFKIELEKYLLSAKDVPVLLSLDDSQILYRDEVKMSEIIDSMDKSNLFFKHSEE